MQAYLVLAGIFASVQPLTRSLTGHPPTTLSMAINACLALVYVALALSLRAILFRSPIVVTLFLVGSIAWIALAFLMGLRAGIGWFTIAFLAVGVIINIYLLRNARRLATELQGFAQTSSATDGRLPAE